MVTVRNRELGTLYVHTVQDHGDQIAVGFRAEAGELVANLFRDGTFTVTDPEYPRLRFRSEAFRPLIEEAIGLWRA